MVVPNINLNGMYAQYQEQGHTMAAMLTMIAQQVQMAPEIRTDWLKDYSQVKDHLFIRVSHAKENEGVLKNAPHKTAWQSPTISQLRECRLPLPSRTR